MAAVLCNGISQCCQGFCRILALPCKACGGCCSALGDACNGCCKATGKACGFIFCQSPFTPYILTTLALQIPPVVWGLLTVFSYRSTECGDFLNIWMYIVALLAAAHILGAFYIALRMAAQTNPNNMDDNHNNSRSGGSGGSVPNERTNINNNNNRTASSTSGGQQQEGKYLWDHVQDFVNNFGSNQPRNRQQQQQQQQAPPPSTGRGQGGSHTWSRLKHLM